MGFCRLALHQMSCADHELHSTVWLHCNFSMFYTLWSTNHEKFPICCRHTFTLGTLVFMTATVDSQRAGLAAACPRVICFQMPSALESNSTRKKCFPTQSPPRNSYSPAHWIWTKTHWAVKNAVLIGHNVLLIIKLSAWWIKILHLQFFFFFFFYNHVAVLDVH